jgi:hypothetical protein
MFNSISEIEDFKRNYNSIKEDILAEAQINLQKESLNYLSTQPRASVVLTK